MKSLCKKKEKMSVKKRKGINLLSEVALTEEAQYEEVHKKSLRDFHKSHPSGSGTVTKIAPIATKIKPSITNEGTGVKPGVPNVTEEESTKRSDQERDSGDDNTQSDSGKGLDSKHETDENESGSASDQEENEEEIKDDEEEEEDKFVKTPSNDTNDEDETKIKDKAERDDDEGMDYTTNQFDDDVNGMKQVIEDAHVTLSTISWKTEVPITSSSHSSDLASKLLNFSDIPHTDAEIISLMDVHVHHEVPSNHTPTLLTVPVSVITESLPILTTVIPQSLPSFTPPLVTTLEKEVVELKMNDPLNTQVTALVDEHLDSRLGATRDEFMSYLSASITARITEQVKSQLP
ncbi:hypothetical protein Tco_0246400 [Tanacetum coccineum]